MPAATDQNLREDARPADIQNAHSGSLVPGVRSLFAAAALLCGLAVAAGAFGAHALATRLAPDLLETFETAARYHLTQSLGVLAMALAASVFRAPALVRSGWLLVAGLGVFSGSLYVLVFTGQRWLGAVTPLGGLLLIGGWISAALVLLLGRQGNPRG
jgi:uncharacterized membrane protein YgdD (TMEM256/DUF423 family)